MAFDRSGVRTTVALFIGPAVQLRRERAEFRDQRVDRGGREVLVVVHADAHGGPRAAARETLRLHQAEQAVFGLVTNLDPELLLAVLEELVGAAEMARDVGAKLEVKLSFRFLPEHLVERGDFVHQNGRDIELARDQSLDIDRQVSELLLS
jgi:hypothetical protein